MHKLLKQNTFCHIHFYVAQKMHKLKSGATIHWMKMNKPKRKVNTKRLLLVLIAVAMLFVTIGSVLLLGLSSLIDGVRNYFTGVSLSIDESKLSVEYGTNFDPKDIITDVHGTVEVDGTVDTHKVGTYPITYILKDKDIRKEYQYTVKVEDHTAPIITMVDSAITVNKGDAFQATSLVSSVKDIVDGNLSYSMELTNGTYTMSGTVDTNTMGTYPVTVTAKDKNGLEASNTTYVTVVDPTISTPYKIGVNRVFNTVTIYAYDQTTGSCTLPVKAMLCSVGPETPAGVFQTFNRTRWRPLYGDVYGQYVTDIVNDILFHSVPYFTQNPSDLEYEEFNKLGTSASLGCVRLSVKDVKWIYDYCPLGVTVEIYDDAQNPGPLGTPEQMKIDVTSPNRGWDPTDPDPNNPWLSTIH